MIIEVNATTLLAAAEIHSKAWQDSHTGFCSDEFIKQHTISHQKEYLENEMNDGKKLYMLIKEKPVGIVSIKENTLIENLYILPTEQHKGYGTELLLFAIGQCSETPRLWILDNNQKAYSLYAKYGFRLTGQKHTLSSTLAEVEMALLICTQ
ncbi:GNAT family N-acetyltransferase [Anaerosporobacter faecicola]|uniref:GNAT family N-acetyltransferase n=1 Tax=Anaerosporobacter faecicola TaxID=2718714 RepID=UPI00143BFB69|nr:GNAT family N-acetyltransferase [Anaerosporobacter faecicola]